MIELVPAEGRAGHKRFREVARVITRPFLAARSTEDDIMHMLVERRSVFFEHAEVRPFILTEGGMDVGHVAFIHDENLPEYAQAAFFGALGGLDGVSTALKEKARACFPAAKKLVVGLNGHLNYSAGILANRFDEPPLFGFNWTPPYYPKYFADLRARPIVSYRFGAKPFYDFAETFEKTFDPRSITVRVMDRSKLRREVELYTELNNACFGKHPYWSNRTPAEDFELFSPFRFLLKEENLIFAEQDGRAVGFLLWYPDFQQLVSRNDETLGVVDVLRYHLRNPIRTVRFTEIGVRPEAQRTMAVPAMILEMVRRVRKGPYDSCEAGFIFEENKASMAMTLRFIRRAVGEDLEPYRRFVVFEGEL